MENIHISITAEKITEIAGFPVTNAVITTVVVSALLIILALIVRSRLRWVPGKLQSFVELVIGWVYDLVKSVAPKHSREFFPLVVTLFLFIVVANWFGLLPGITGIGIETYDHGEHVFIPLFRAATADLNTTLALAIVTMVMVQYYGIKHIGVGLHLKKFFDFSSPIAFFIGIIELISEFGKIISLAFRLFGNIFAGEVLLVIIGVLVPLFVPLPFLGLEVFVGFVQALVFAMLALVFSALAVEHH